MPIMPGGGVYTHDHIIRMRNDKLDDDRRGDEDMTDEGTTSPVLTHEQEDQFAEIFNAIDEERVAQQKAIDFLKSMIPVMHKKTGRDCIGFEEKGDTTKFTISCKRDSGYEDTHVTFSDNFIVNITSRNDDNPIFAALLSKLEGSILTNKSGSVQFMGGDIIASRYNHGGSNYSYADRVYDVHTIIQIPVDKALPHLKRLLGYVANTYKAEPDKTALNRIKAKLK